MIETTLASKSEFATLPGQVMLTFDGPLSMRLAVPAEQAGNYSTGKRYSVTLEEVPEPSENPDAE